MTISWAIGEQGPVGMALSMQDRNSVQQMQAVAQQVPLPLPSSRKGQRKPNFGEIGGLGECWLEISYSLLSY